MRSVTSHHHALSRHPGTGPKGVTARPLSSTLEREIAGILAQVAPKRQADDIGSRVVSILAVSISEFAALCEEIEPAAVGAVLDTYLQTVADSIGKFLGTVQGVMGDVVLATWNATYPQSDHALFAVNAALDLMGRIEDVNMRLRVADFPEVAFAAGVNTGAVQVQSAGRLQHEGDVVGDTVTTALLLSRIADGGVILMGEGTQVSVGEQIHVEDRGSIELPGKRKAVRVFRVIAGSMHL